MKEITFFLGTMSEGGAERVVANLANELVSDYPVSIVTYYKDEICYSLNEKVKLIAIEEKTSTKSKRYNSLWLRRYVKRNTRILISFLAPFNIFALLSCAFTKVPIIVADRNDPRVVPSKRIVRFLRNLLYLFSKKVVVQTEKNKDYFSNCLQKKIVIIPNPINVGAYAGSALQSKHDKVIISVGRLMPQKNFILLISAFEIVHSKYCDYRLIILGEGPERIHLEKIIKEKRLTNCISLPGKTNKVFDELQKAELFVLSSNFEGMPNALIEAMSLGLPVVSTAVSGATDLIQNNWNGILVPVENVSDLADAMVFLLDNKNEAEKMATNASEINKSLSIETITRKWRTIIDPLFD